MSRIGKTIVGLGAISAVVAASCWLVLKLTQRSIPWSELSTYFGESFFTEKEKRLWDEFDGWRRQEDFSAADGVIAQHKFDFRELHHKLLLYSLWLQFKNRPDSAQHLQQAAVQIAAWYDRFLREPFFQRQNEYCFSLDRKQCLQKLASSYCYRRGEELIYSGSSDSATALAKKYFVRCYKRSRKIGDQKQAIDCLLKQQYFLYKEGKYPAALNLAQEVLAETRAMGYRYRESWALFSIGTVQLNLGDYKPGLSNFEAALAIARQLDDQIAVMTMLERICVALRNLGQFLKALQANQESLAISKQLGRRSDQIRNYINLGLIYKNLGDYTQAIRNFDMAYRLAHERNDFNESTALGNLGETYRILGDLERALHYDSLQLRLNESWHNYYLIARSQAYLGHAYQDQGHLDKAMQAYQQALETIEHGQQGSDPKSLTAEINQHMGDIQREQHRWPQAIEYYRRALDTYREIEKPEGMAIVLTNIGNVYRRMGDFDNAWVLIQESRQIAEMLNDPILLWNSYYSAGSVFRERKELSAAAAAYRRAIAVAEKTRERIYGDEDRMNYFATIQDLYDAMIALQYDLASNDSALIYSERSHARSFFDLCYSHPMIINHDSLTQGGLNRLDIVTQANIDLPPLAAMQQSLGSEIIVIEYKMTAQDLFVFVIDQTSVFAVKIHRSQKELRELVDRYRATIGADGQSLSANRRFITTASRFEQAQTLATELYDILIQPIESWLPAGKTLCIVPDGELGYLPFAALVTTHGSNGKPEYLIQRFPLVFAPSTAVLKYQLDHRHGSRPLADYRILAVGNPTGDLPGSEQEARKVAAYFVNSTVLLGEAATKDSLCKLLTAHHDVLHLATHVVIDEKSPLYSYLVLAGDRTLAGGNVFRQSLQELLTNSHLLMT
ncbi:MAG: tetratricopeptide repeat protein, partial [candidate division KSB1 bacterium]|nr:tetratricopeptide repeat protein [candidate division KSB1 bacterium]